MRNILLALLLLGFPLFGEVSQEVVQALIPKLNTQRIEYFFGNSDVQVLDIDTPYFVDKRVSNLHSVDANGKKTMRCLAVVDFASPMHHPLVEIHEKIQKGSAIGSTIKAHGWNITKVPIYFSTISLSPQVMEWMDEKESDEAALHMYRLDVSHPDVPETLSYCTIIEIHSPQYLTSEYVRALYSDQYETHQERTELIDDILSRCSHLIEHFPSCKGK